MSDVLDGMSMDVEKDARQRLKAVFPECFVEDKLDIDKLLTMCGEYITNDFEKYKFEWKGKSECLLLAQKRSTSTLRPKQDESVNFDDTQNVYIKGDNLEVLKLLQTAYYRQVKQIYIDPPFNTGHDFVYEDNFSDPIGQYRKVTAQATRSNPETMGRFHTNWLNLMYPRLRLASNLLRDDGVIFLSIDDNEVHNLRKVCDEIFGEENFLGCISISSNPRGRQSDTYFATVHDYLLVYAKYFDECVINGLPLSGEQKGEYKFEDDNGEAYRLLGLRQRGSASLREDRPDMYFPIYVHNETKEVYLTKQSNCSTVLPKKSDGRDGRWMWGKEKCLKETNRLVAKFIERRNEYDIFVKDFLNRGSGERTRKAKTIWDDKFCNNQFGTQEVKQLLQGDFMSYPKPKEFIMNICRIGTNPDENDIILDFFSGSATTAHAVMQLNAEDGGNRRFIMVQLPELCDEKSEAYKAGYKTICDIGMERIRRAGAKIKAEVGRRKAEENRKEEENQLSLAESSELRTPTSELSNLDVGFKVFELDSSNLKTWDGTPVTQDDLITLFERMNNMLHRVKPDRTDLDMVYEIMLKMGIPLTYSVTEMDALGVTAYGIGDDCLLLICLAENITPEIVEALADYAPAKLILGERCLQDDTAMANAHFILRDRGIQLKLV